MDVVAALPDHGVGPAALALFASGLSTEFGPRLDYLDVYARRAIEQLVIRIGGLSGAFPRFLLHRYMFGRGEPLTLTPQQIVRDVGPVGSIYDPNSMVTTNENAPALRQDIENHLQGAQHLPGPKSFAGTYRFSCFHSVNANGGGGLGHFSMIAQVQVQGTGHHDWALDGTAKIVPELWDFDWKILTLLEELWQSRKLLSKEDVEGRERRAALGSLIPGTPYLVDQVVPLRVRQQSGKIAATFSA
ncbi:MAG: hypothetical protein RLZZ450_6269 [Pseudomonadota bacterium]